MSEREWSQFWHHRQLNLSLLQAYYAVHAYPRHTHDYYVIALVDRGMQSFTYGGAKHVTPPNGLIFLNPAEVHTGEPVDEQGFAYRALYPTAAHMAAAYCEVTGRTATAPLFAAPRADDLTLAQQLRRLHHTLQQDAVHASNPLESESHLLLMLVQLLQRYGAQPAPEPAVGREEAAVQRACAYLQAHYAEGISLTTLAAETNLSRYYLLRTFRNRMGMPPHAYQESIRIRHAQHLLATGMPLAEVAYAVGYSSQPHFTQRFKQIIGVTPGAYCATVRAANESAAT